MITAREFAGRRYAVLGLARSGLAAVETLVKSGAKVTAWDIDPAARAAAEGLVDLADPLTMDLSGYAGVVVSPGVPLNRHPIVGKAWADDVSVIGDIDLFAQARPELPPHRVVGITGTNGKSTTTALVHHIIAAAGIPTCMGGNIGLPILRQEPLPRGGIYVLELSSYQIDLTYDLDCDIAVLLNITPDHLDRYRNFEHYATSKARLIGMQSANRKSIIVAEDELTRSLASHYFLSEVVTTQGLTQQDNWPALKGPHNAQNAAAAIAVARALRIAPDIVEAALCSYPGLPHRMEPVRTINGVQFINNSKATNTASTAPALATFTGIHWIVGGRAKSDDLDLCAPYYHRVAAAYTIGEAGPRFAEILAPHMRVNDCADLDTAVKRAAQAARPGEVVLLSPACASFDQFSDFEARGAAFRAAVEAL